MSKVYTFGPTFRAENSNTSRHLAEFWMIEPEVAFADLDDVAQLAEDLLKYVFKAVLEERGDDMAFFAQRINKEAISRLEKVVDSEFVRMDYTTQLKSSKTVARNLSSLLNGVSICRLNMNVTWRKNMLAHLSS